MANTIINTPELLNLDSTTGATILAKGTISERPTGSAAIDGALRFNTDTNKTEYFDGTGWYEIVDEYASGFVGPGTNYFDTKLYTGNGTTKSISTLNFQPGLTWVKAREQANDNILVDSVNGAGSNKGLNSNAAYYEGQYTATYGYISSLDSNGFTVSAGSSNANYTNVNNKDYVSWNWKAGGGAVLNEVGDIDSQVSVNRDSGFSIVKYTGSNSASGTVGHGLADAEIIILKDLTDGTNNWRVWQKDLSANYWMYLNLTLEEVSAATDGGIRNVDATTFGFINGTTGGVEGVNSSASNYVAYCWQSVAGYSKIGTYLGNGNATGTIVQTGFTPSWVIIKNATSSGAWCIFDSARNPTNSRYNLLQAQDSAAEIDLLNLYGLEGVDFLSTSFQLKDTNASRNTGGETYLYMAFA
tara:strand:+ start:746 stop:1987 length:1242 start_codon:yes stop_codon:yes gene_type:complete